MPTELLRLGTKIVQDLDLSYSVDTLSRWMSHHLAEKMIELESLEGEEKSRVEKEVVQLIQTLWTNKHSWPSGVTPLNQYGALKDTLTRLGPSSSPFNSHRHNQDEKLLAAIFFGLKQTVINGAILISDDRKLPADLNGPLDAFNADERLFIETIRGWVEFSINRPADKSSFEFYLETRTSPSEEKLDELTEDKLVEIISTDIDKLISDLESLKLQFSKRSRDEG